MSGQDNNVAFLAELLQKLGELSEKLAANNNAEYLASYAKLKVLGIDQKVEASILPANEPKNRYKNVPGAPLPPFLTLLAVLILIIPLSTAAFDHSRVVLKNGPDGDYINANWIKGSKGPKQYIATQGPVPPAIADFWHMVWEYDVSVIIKVTREVESGTLKCHRYWPDPNATPPQLMALFGLVEVEHKGTTAHSFYIERSFEIRKGTEKRTLTQFSYEAWPDHGVPSTTREFLEFREACKKYTDKSKGPVVIHCSAGVGRTGTYITVDRVLDAVASGKKSRELDIDSTVKDLRMSRVYMVQTDQQ